MLEHPVADRMPVAVVDPLEVVDVDEAEAERLAVAHGLRQLVLQPLVEVPVVAEAGEWIREREPHCTQHLERRPLVERNREQWPDERDRERRRALPEHDERQRRRRHQRKRRGRLPDVRGHQLEERLARVDREHRADQDQVDDPVVDERADCEPREQSSDRVLRNRLDRQPARKCREREHRAVVGNAQRRASSDEMGDGRPAGSNQDARLPAEEQDAGDCEDEAERDAARIHLVDGDRETLGQDHAGEESCDGDHVADRVRRGRVRHGSHTCGRDPRHTDGDHEREDSRGNLHAVSPHRAAIRLYQP